MSESKDAMSELKARAAKWREENPEAWAVIRAEARALWQRGDPTPNLNAAFAKAQGAMLAARKDSENPAFKRDGKASTYADLASVIDACRKPLADNGLAFVQTNVNDREGVTVTTTLLHASGEQISSPFWVPVGASTAQGYGAASTYARRFGLSALLGVAADDDDGNEASQRHQPTTGESQQAMAARHARQAGIGKMIDAYAAMGVSKEELESRLGHNISTITDEEWMAMRKAYEMKKGKYISSDSRDVDPDEAARQEVAAQAEASLTAAEAARPSVPQTPEQTSRALTQSIFAALIDKIRAAETDKAVLLIGAEFPAMEKTLSKGDMAALRRAYADRLMVLQDKTREAKKPKMKIEDVP